MKRFRLLKKVLQGLAVSMASLLVTFLVVEFLVLRLIDPLGIRRYHADLDLMFKRTEPDEQRGWIQKPGVYSLSASTATVTQEGRLTPDTNHAALCTIAAVGDSATFGHGINDRDVWVNLVAHRYQQAHFINAGVTGYNIENVQATLATLDAAGYLYVIAGNDAEPQLSWSQDLSSPPSYSAMELYFRHIFISLHEQSQLKTSEPDLRDYRAFDDRLQEILSHNVKAFVFDDPWPLNQHIIKAFPQVTALAQVTSVNSWADPHASPAGHQQIADEVIPAISDWLPQICGQ